MAISAALKEIYSANPSGVYYMEAFSIEHAKLAKPLHITKVHGGFTGSVLSKDELFEYAPFEVKLPDKDTNGTQSISIIMANDEQNMIDDIEMMSERPYLPARCYYRVFISSDTTASGAYKQQLNPAWRFDISSVVVTHDTITVVASRENMHNRSWPRQIYRADRFPGLDS